MLSPPKVFNIDEKTPEKQTLNFSRSALFHIEARVCLKYFAHDCRHGHNYTKCKMSLSMIRIGFTKLHLRNI